MFPLMIATDLMRAYIIYEFGGVYFDVDYKLIKDITWLVDSTDFFISVE